MKAGIELENGRVQVLRIGDQLAQLGLGAFYLAGKLDTALNEAIQDDAGHGPFSLT